MKMKDWCRTNVGIYDQDWVVLWSSSDFAERVFCFRNEEDANLFRVVMPR